MKTLKYYVILLILLTFSFNALAVDYDDSINNSDTNIFQQGIGVFNGLYDTAQVILDVTEEISLIRSKADDNVVNINGLNDETTVQKEEIDDFYNDLQKQNAEGNVTLFTQKDLNRITRDKTTVYTLSNINWIYMLIIMIIELFKIILNLSMLLMAIWLFFRIIPQTFKFVKNLVFKIMVKVEK